jgi:hypothetical protein
LGSEKIKTVIYKIPITWQIRMVLVLISCQKGAGIIEYWNDGMMVPFQKTQFSSIPSFQLSKETRGPQTLYA